MIDKPRLPKTRMKYVAKEEFDHLYESIRGDGWTQWRDRLLFTILFFSGLRASEVVELRLSDIERNDGILLVRSGKGDKDRVMPYAPQLPELLDTYLAKRPPWPDNKPLFVSNNGVGGISGPMGYNGFRQMLRRRCQRAAMPTINLHAFRHGFAMWALNNGVSLSAVSAMMGHTSVVVTESVYAHWVTGAIKREYAVGFDRLNSDEAI